MTDLIATLEGLTGQPTGDLTPLYDGAKAAGIVTDWETELWFGAALRGHLDAVGATIALVKRTLPGWTWRVATCHVSDDAWVIPDFNHPVHGERLMREFGQVEGDPSSYWQEITDVDLRPSGRPAIALCIALLRALEARDGTE